ncbi:transcriptional regulator ArgP [Actinosynnema pretiosum subsp. pretiosum]|nr:transcriptional regulator ArgP [Actinosynnema pretiosum subsp. pretiosum]
MRTLLTVLDEGTFDAAAKTLHITPSAVSQRIRQLEQRAGRVLLVRSRPVVATESGAAIARYGRQLARLAEDTGAELELATTESAVPVAVNADSLSTWFRLVVRELAGDVRLALHREDQDHTAELLRRGQVVAAVTSSPTPVQGCAVRPLGRMRYHAVATPEFAARWLPGGVGRLADAPVAVFDDKDDLQDAFCRDLTGRPASARRHHLPDGPIFVDTVTSGAAWALLTEAQIALTTGLTRLARSGRWTCRCTGSSGGSTRRRSRAWRTRSSARRPPSCTPDERSDGTPDGSPLTAAPRRQPSDGSPPTTAL